MHATIIGLGLIGGSIAKALHAAGWGVGFIDPAVSPDEAITARAAHDKYGSPSEIPQESLIVLAMPVDICVQMMLTIDALPNLTTSVASVMHPLVKAASQTSWRFVPGHPLAGSHERGITNARPDLFLDRKWFVGGNYLGTPVEELIAVCGARAVPVDPEEHDLSLALTSHLPQLLSTALASIVDQAGVDLDTYAGSGLRTFLRLAGSDRSIWHSVFDSNNANVSNALQQLAIAADEMLSGDDEEHFDRANTVWRRLDEPQPRG